MRVPHNRNFHIFHVEGLDGPGGELLADPSGAVLEHLHSLGGLDRMAYEELYAPESGGLFAPEALPRNRITQPADGEQTDPAETSDDVLDHPEALCSLEEIEKGIRPREYTGTPRPGYRYMGDWKTPYADLLPTTHPDYEAIQDAAAAAARGLYTLRRHLKGLFFLDKSVPRRMLALTREDTFEGDFASLLEDIDQETGSRYREKALRDTDPALTFLKLLRARIRSSHPSTETSSYIKALGQALYRGHHPHINGGNRFRTSWRHWQAYREIKKLGSPPIVIGSLDINRCYVHEMSRLPGFSWETARDISLGRPFDSLEDIVRAGSVGWRGLAIASDPEACRIVDRMREGSITPHATSKVIALIQKKRGGIVGIEAVWEYYKRSRAQRRG